MILHLEIQGEPIPFQRPRSNNGRFFNASKYSEYKKNLARHFKTFWADYILPTPPSTQVPSERRKFIKKYVHNKRYSLSVQVYTKRSMGDLSNYVKAIEDALQDARIIHDDIQIDSYHPPFFKEVDKDNPRVIVGLKGLF